MAKALDSGSVLLWCWTIAIVAFFTASRFKLDHYVFPAAPALCLICARGWADFRTRVATTANTGARLGAQTVGPILVLAGAGGGYFMIARLDLPAVAIVVPIAMLVAGLVVTARASFTNARRLPAVPWITLAAMTATYAGVILVVMPALEQRKVVPDVARWVKEHAGTGTDAARIGTYRLNRWSNAFRFYVDRPTTHMNGVEEARAFFADPRPGYAVMTRQYLYELAGQGVALQVEYDRDGMWVTSGRALWRRREPPTHFVVVSRKTAP
jgi:4-amino-4-deoxy-L-arabinose transferase-like glycosyltransferase